LAAIAVSGLAAVSTFSGCGMKKDENAKTISQQDAEKLKAQGKNAEAAEKYARLGEMLLVPEGLEYADDFFNQALALDPKNGKANFSKVSTGPAMTLKGFFPRVQRLVNNDDIENFERARN